MLDIKYIRLNPKAVEESAKNKGVEININDLLQVDSLHRETAQKVQSLREEKNALNEQIKKNPDQFNKEHAQSRKQKLEKEEAKLKDLEQTLRNLLLRLPNPAKPDVIIGKDETGNKVIKVVGDPTSFSFEPKDHLVLGESLGIIDVKQAATVSGARFYYLKNDGALLEFALRQYAFDTLIKEGFIPIVPPVMIKKEIMEGLGYTQMGDKEEIYTIEDENLYLVGTAEQSIVPYHMNDVLRKEDLPRRYVGFSTAFRREAGSYGKDTRGIFRVHQFDKTEMVSFVAEGDDDREHEFLLSIEERFMQQLGIPYQVINVCTGDLGFNAARKYDIEAWIPTQQKYREMTSASTVTDFQSRRLNMKYQDGNEKKYLNVLNGTAFSTRPLVAILENYQQEDGSVVVPEVLRKYMGKDILKKS
ncbi:MAG: serine--tRNA ligase [Patescibacteria group bacterium]